MMKLTKSKISLSVQDAFSIWKTKNEFSQIVNVVFTLSNILWSQLNYYE
jgi:hypothetical protein